jgi:hypothetical protein
MNDKLFYAIILFVWLIMMHTDADAMEFTYSDDYTYAEFGLGANTNITGCSKCWDDANKTGAIIVVGHRWELDGYWDGIYVDVSWVHLSQFNAGAPFNRRRESSVDFIGAKVGVYFR